MSSHSNRADSTSGDELVENGFSRRGERYALPIVGIICYVVAIMGVYAPWFSRGA
ncbi:MAG: hypothetical protein ABI298_05610 [Acidimicrobiales bacterium]